MVSLGEERTILSAFCAFVRFALDWFCLFPLPLRAVACDCALPRLFYYFIFTGTVLIFASLQFNTDSAKSDHGLHCPLTKSLNTTECINGEQRPG